MRPPGGFKGSGRSYASQSAAWTLVVGVAAPQASGRPRALPSRRRGCPACCGTRKPAAPPPTLDKAGRLEGTLDCGLSVDGLRQRLAERLQQLRGKRGGTVKGPGERQADAKAKAKQKKHVSGMKKHAAGGGEGGEGGRSGGGGGGADSAPAPAPPAAVQLADAVEIQAAALREVSAEAEALKAAAAAARAQAGLGTAPASPDAYDIVIPEG